MKKNVLLFLYGPLSNSGVPNVMLTIVKSLNQHLNFTVMAIKGGALEKEFEKLGVKIEYLQENRPKSKWPRRIYDYTCRYQNIANQLNNFLKQNKIDVIHCCSGFDGGLYVKVASKCGVPIRILHCHGKFSIKTQNLFKKLQIHKYRKLIERYTTVKLSCSKEAGESFFPSTKNMLVMVNPIDIEYYANIIKTTSNTIRILQIGIFNENKNQLFSLKLLKELIENGYLVKLSFIGYDINSVYGKKMLNYIESNNLQNYVDCLSHNYDKRKIFTHTDVLLLPSYTEACPLVALEAQAAKVPVLLSTNVPNDVDFGLCKYIPLTNFNEWLNNLQNIKTNNYVLSSQFNQISIENYTSELLKIYNEFS